MPDIWMDVDTAVIVPVNILPLLDDTDFKSIETAIVYNSTGLAVTWNFVTAAGVVSGVAITPTTGGVYDWSEPVADKGMYAIEIPASGGASANNDTEGVGWITGVATGVLPWRGPTIGFRRAALNDLFMDGSTASTNLEDFFDGTGYAGGTAKLTVDAVAISGDSTAADNLETMLDGTGGQVLSLGQLNIVASGNNSALVATGAGTGKGIAATGGASGAGIYAIGGATANGYGIYAQAQSANCYGLHAVGSGATESGGIKGVANTSGEGIEGLAAGNGHGLYVVGAGTGEGIHATAGGGANGHGAHFEGVGANSHGALFSRGGAGGDDMAFQNNDVTIATVTTATNVTTVNGLANGVITAAAIATNAIDADALATDAVTEIQSGLSTLTTAQVNAEVDTALADINLDHLVGTATGIPAIPAGTYIDQLMDDGTATFDRTTDSLQAIRDRGDAAWDTADVSGLALQTSVDDLEGRLTATRAGYLDNLSGGAVALQSSVDDLEGRLTATRAGYLDNLSGGAVALQSSVDDLEGRLTATRAGYLDNLSGGAVATAASVSALNNLSAAQVNAEVVDALTVDVIADSVAADGSRPTIAQALLEITRWLMERSVSGTTVTVKKEDGSTTAMTFTLNDGTTPTSITRAT